MTDKNKFNKKQENNKKSYVGFGIAFGLLGGAMVSSITGIFVEFPLIWAFGPGLGMLIGIGIGWMIDSSRREGEK